MPHRFAKRLICSPRNIRLAVMQATQKNPNVSGTAPLSASLHCQNEVASSLISHQDPQRSVMAHLRPKRYLATRTVGSKNQTDQSVSSHLPTSQCCRKKCSQLTSLLSCTTVLPQGSCKAHMLSDCSQCKLQK